MCGLPYLILKEGFSALSYNLKRKITEFPQNIKDKMGVGWKWGAQDQLFLWNRMESQKIKSLFEEHE